MHTYPYFGIVSATGDVAIKKPKRLRTMDFHGLSLRPLVVKGLKCTYFSQIELSTIEYCELQQVTAK